MDRPIVACVLAGGAGTRLYPASRSHRPKQFLALEPESDRSLLESALERAGFADRRYVLTGETHAERVDELASDADVLVEPRPKDTGPALVYAAWRLRRRVGDCVLVCLPSDHHVGDDEAFAAAAERASRVAVETGGLVTLGVEPTRPATGYGYVEPADRSGTTPSGDAYEPVAQFREKPDREAAERLLERGAYWNAGYFAWTPDALLREARDSPLAPLVETLEGDDLDSVVEEGAAGAGAAEGDSETNAGGPDPIPAFDAVDPISVDYAIMERTDAAFVTPLEAAWDDLGTWDAVGRVREDGEEGAAAVDDVDGNAPPGDVGQNAAVGDTEVLTLDAADNVVAAPGKHVSLVGVEDLVVATYGDRVLVAPREEGQRVREVAARLREDARF